MAEITLSASDIATAITKGLEGYKPSVEARTVGRVTEVGDGIARVSGLPDCAVNELLEFADGSVGLALNLDEDSIGAVVLGDSDGIEEGQAVKPGDVLIELDAEVVETELQVARALQSEAEEKPNLRKKGLIKQFFY